MSICTICFRDSPDGTPHPACVETGETIAALMERITDAQYERVIAGWPEIHHAVGRKP